jgi:hypothetical protein
LSHFLTALETAQTTAGTLFALVDPAQDRRLPDVLVSNASQVVCLFEDAGTDVKAVAPHLVMIEQANRLNAMAWLDRHAPHIPCATLLASPLSLAELCKHLADFLQVTLADRTEMVLAFWDPMILAALVGAPEDPTLHVTGPVFSETQRSVFLAPVSSWWYWDRAGRLQFLNPDARAASRDPDASILPLTFDQRQVDLIVEASVPDSVLHYIRLNQPGLLTRLPHGQQYAFIRTQIATAREYGIEGTGDLVNYCCLALALGEAFAIWPAVAALLARVKAKELSFDDFMAELPAVLSQSDASV